MIRGWIVSLPPIERRFRAAVIGALGLVMLHAGCGGRAELDRLRTAIEAVRADWQVPGIAVGVVRDGEVVLAEGFGVREADRSAPVTRRTLFSIGSCTKAFTAAALSLLVDEGAVGWDDPVADYLPAFAMPDSADSHRVTIRDLLAHRSGLAGGDLLSWGSSFGRDQIVARLRYLATSAPLRTEFHYANVTYVAAGEVIPVVIGSSWEDFISSRLLQPLAMEATVTSITDIERSSNVASPHHLADGGVRLIPPINEDNCAAAGSIWSNVDDMNRWIRMLLAGGELDGRRVLSPASLAELWRLQMPVHEHYAETLPRAARPLMEGYGLGWNLRDWRGRLLVRHAGQTDGMMADVALIPEERLGIVVLMNLHDSDAYVPLEHLILDHFLGERPAEDWNRVHLRHAALEEAEGRAARLAFEQERAPEAAPSAPIAAFAGDYRSPAVGIARVRLRAGRLSVELAEIPMYRATLEHWHDDVFVAHWDYPLVEPSPIAFEVAADGVVHELVILPDASEWMALIEYRFERMIGGRDPGGG